MVIEWNNPSPLPSDSFFPTLRADKPTMLLVVFSFKQTRPSWFVANFWLKYFELLTNQILRHSCCKYVLWRTNYRIKGKESRHHYLLFLEFVFPGHYTFSANICSYHPDNVVQHSCLFFFNIGVFVFNIRACAQSQHSGRVGPEHRRPRWKLK